VDAVVTFAVERTSRPHSQKSIKLLKGPLRDWRHSVGQYVKEAHTFYIKDNIYHVYEVEVRGSWYRGKGT
jgi:hypothetical protein